MNTVAIPRTVSVTGRAVSFDNPLRGQIAIGDIAEQLARLTPSPATRAFYSYAQRACALADAAIDDGEGPEMALRAMLLYAPLAYMAELGARADFAGYLEERAARAQHLTTLWDRLAATIHLAHDLDWPVRPQYLAVLHARLELTELQTLRNGVEREIAAMLAKSLRPVRPINPWPQAKCAERFLESWSKYAIAAGINRGRGA